MDSSDYSHLYHDSHFNTGVLEAREHLKARENNAREQRLLQQQDQQLQQAKNTWRRRHSWQQDCVRRDLLAILERTPTFDRSFRDERRRLSVGHERNPLALSTARGSLPRIKTVTSGAVAGSLNPVCVSVPICPERKFSPVALEGMADILQNGTGTTSGRKKRDGPGASKVQFSDQQATFTILTDQQPDKVLTTCSRPRDGTETERVFQTPTLASPRHRHSLSGPLPDVSLSAGTEGLTLEQRKGALLRRRGHSALMALVRVKARHDQRMLHAHVPGEAESSADSKVLTENDPADSPSTVSWLSVPVATAGDHDSEVFSSRDINARPRDRFFSAD